jgi:hypothetical protein
MGLAAVQLTVALVAAPAEARRQGRCLGHEATISGRNLHLHARGHRRVIVGTPRRDVIVGSRHGDWIVGAGGRDIVCGGGGSDYMFAGNVGHSDRPSRLFGGPGDDYLDGSYAGDRIYGGPGDDRIDGEFGGDRIDGGGGDDFIRAQRGGDRIAAGRGADHVEASTGEDVVRGGPGGDKISTGPDTDLVFGGRGDDRIFLVWGDDVGYGGRGDDYFQGGRGEDICFGGWGNDFAAACEHRRSIERIPGPEGSPAPGARARPHHSHRHRSARAAPHRSRSHRARPHGRIRPFDEVRAIRRLQGFLHRLRHRRVIKTAAITRHQLRRSAALGRQARIAVDRRYERRLRDRHRIQAAFRRSVEHYRVRAIRAAISNQIDRLRWTPANRRR